jgi:hypothetical protein
MVKHVALEQEPLFSPPERVKWAFAKTVAGRPFTEE